MQGVGPPCIPFFDAWEVANALCIPCSAIRLLFNASRLLADANWPTFLERGIAHPALRRPCHASLIPRAANCIMAPATRPLHRAPRLQLDAPAFTGYHNSIYLRHFTTIAESPKLMPNDNLVVIAAMARKGGSGKTTLSRALISAAVAAKRRVLLIDTDSTGVLGTWLKRADTNGLGSPLLSSATAKSVTAVDRTIEQVYEEDLADFIFIDTAGVGAEWSDGIAVLADHIVTPVMLSTSDLDVGAQTADWFEKLRSRVDDPDNLPRHHVVLNMVDPKTTRADAALIGAAVTRFPVVETVMLRRNAYKEMDEKGLLHAIALQKQADPNPLMRPHVRHVVEALEEATDILNNILAA
jgi:chromosome partitioning protein